MTGSSKAIVGGLSTGGIIATGNPFGKMFSFLCSLTGAPIEACDPLAEWVGAILAGVITGLIVHAVPNKE